MVLTAITSEGLFIHGSEAIRNPRSLSYFQFRALEDFIVISALHDEIRVVVGEEQSSDYRARLESACSVAAQFDGLRVQLVDMKATQVLMDRRVYEIFETICEQLYGITFGLDYESLFKKSNRDRSAAELSDYLIRQFVISVEESEPEVFSECVRSVWSRNANSPEMLYFVRGHMIAAIAARHNWSCFVDNYRSLFLPLMGNTIPDLRLSADSLEVYRLLNTAFFESVIRLGVWPNDQPSIGFLPLHVFHSALTADDLARVAVTARAVLAPFRIAVSERMSGIDSGKTLKELESMRARSARIYASVLAPAAITLSSEKSSRQLTRLIRNFDPSGSSDTLKLKFGKPSNATDDLALEGALSLSGIAIATAQVVVRTAREQKDLQEAMGLLKVLESVCAQPDPFSRWLEFCRIRDRRSRETRVIDAYMSNS